MDFPPLSEVSFWWGIALAVPLAIIANLLTPLFFKAIGYFSTAAKKKINLIEQQERKMASVFAKNKPEYSSYQFNQVMKFAIIGAFSGLFGGVFASGAHLVFILDIPELFGQIFFILSQMVAIISAIVTLKYCEKKLAHS
ncbi:MULTISPECIES: hypothetical protein [Methylobacter]